MDALPVSSRVLGHTYQERQAATAARSSWASRSQISHQLLNFLYLELPSIVTIFRGRRWSMPSDLGQNEGCSVPARVVPGVVLWCFLVCQACASMLG